MHFNKELVMTKKDDEDFENSNKCWICNNNYVDGYLLVRDHCHITGKYRGYAHSNFNIKFNLKINDIPNRLEKYMSFSINDKMRFVDSFQFLSFSLDSLVKNFGKKGFKYLSQEFHNSVLDLVK